jgi:hypothetical protein
LPYPIASCGRGGTAAIRDIVLATAANLDFNPTPEDVNVPVSLWTVPVGKVAHITDIRLRNWTFGAGPPWPIGDSVRIIFGWNGAQDIAGWDTEEAGQFPGIVVSIANDNVDLVGTPPRGIFSPGVMGNAGDTFDLIFTRETGGDPLLVTIDVIGYLA